MSKQNPNHQQATLPTEGFIRVNQLSQILGVAIVTCWRWSAQGRLPAPLKLSDRVTVWRAEDIRTFINAQGKAA